MAVDPIDQLPVVANPTKPEAVVVNDPDGTPASALVDLDARYVEVAGDTMTGKLTVPDASADGEAIAYDQASWQLAGGTLTGELGLDAAAPIITFNETDQAADAGAWRFAPFAGTLYIGPATDAGTLQAQSFRLERNGDVTLAASGGGAVTVPAIDGTSQAAQVTAFDSPTGQLAIGGHEVGDTGVRDVSSSGLSLDATWDTVTNAELVRTGSQVALALNLTSSTSVSSGQAIGTIPTGFRPSMEVVYAQTFGGLDIYVSTAGELRFNGTAQQSVRLYLPWHSDNTWPASLPGV